MKLHISLAGIGSRSNWLARLGAVVGALDGYPKTRDGGWFPAVIPAVSMEYKYVGTNILIVPSYKNRLYGAISVQVKLRVF